MLTRIKGKNLEEQEEFGMALSFNWIDVPDQDAEDGNIWRLSQEIISHINIWQMEGENKHEGLLSSTIKPSALTTDHFVAVIVLDWEHPWTSKNCHLSRSGEGPEALAGVPGPLPTKAGPQQHNQGPASGASETLLPGVWRTRRYAAAPRSCSNT